MSQKRNRLKWLYEQLPDWERRGWIGPEGVAGIRERYGPVEERDYQQAILVGFAVLAALLIGGGVILVFAHNWEALSRPVRAVLSVAPLLVTQALCCYTIARHSESTAWRESAAVANSAALAAGIGLIGQTYNIPGNLGSFLLAVSLLSLPVAYLLRSRWNLVLYLCAIVWWRWLEDAGLGFWILWLLALPGLWVMSPLQRTGSRIVGIAVLLAAATGLPVDEGGLWWGVALWSLFAAGLIGWSSTTSVAANFGRTPRYLGLAGMAILLLVASDLGAWGNEDFYMGSVWPPVAILLPLAGLGATGIVAASRQRDWIGTAWATAGVAVVLLRLAIYLLDQETAGAILANVIVLVLAAFTVWIGYQRKSLSQVNWALAFLALYLALRFFDGQMSILARAGAFILLGLGLILINFFLSRRLKQEAAQ